jgi:predicted CopG family antitoxin
MSVKNVALDTRVYDKLAGLRKDSESFTKAIERLINQRQSAHTGKELLAWLAEFDELNEKEAKSILKIVNKARTEEKWPRHDLR